MSESDAVVREDGLPTIGLAIIAKDEQETLPRLLESVGLKAGPRSRKGNAPKPRVPAEAAVDYVVVCDTGSSDKTKQVAARYGCEVIDFEWCDDFSAARQASYDALPEWLDFTLWADCDDVIANAGALRQIAAQLPPAVAGTLHRYDYAQDAAGNTITELWRERLVRRHAAVRWLLPIHEILDVQGGQLTFNHDVVWHHRMPADRAERVDPERNYRILMRDYETKRVAGELADPRTVAYLGTEAISLGKLAIARELLREYLDRSDATFDQERCQVAHKLSIAWRMGDDADLDAAARAAHRAIDERPDWPDGYLDLAEIALNRQEWGKAVQFCDQAARLDKPQTLLITNPLEYEYQPKLMKAVALGSLGQLDEAWELLQQVLAITPYRQDLRDQAAAVHAQLVRRQAIDHVLELREILVRHDENYKARQLMDWAVPYFVANDPQIAAARLDQREMTLHATDPDVYESYYRHNPGEAPFENTGVPVETAHEVFHRVDFLRRGLDTQVREAAVDQLTDDELAAERASLRILDLTCNDGWMLANLALAGYGTGEGGCLHGTEMNDDAAKRARERLHGLDVPIANARIEHGNLHNAAELMGLDPDPEWSPETRGYDAVILFETIEHVPDPRETLATIVKLVLPTIGRLYVSTPEGAYERGNVPGWANVESKGHLWALTPSDLTAMLAELGLIADMEIEGRVQVAALKPAPRKGRIDFVAGPTEALPELILDTGMGGSETALCKLAEHFARRGYDVRVFAGESAGGPRGDHVTVDEQLHTGGQVLYAPWTAWRPDAPADVCVVSRMPQLLDRTITAPRRVLWLHDATYGDGLTLERAERATDVAVLSEFQRDLLIREYPFLANHEVTLWQTRNGIETKWFAEGDAGGVPIADREPRVVYSSSPDRGLEVLLELWPRIREQVPGAELHHTYAPFYRQVQAHMPHLVALNERIAALTEATEGVVAHDSMGQRELAELFCSARVWAYPSWQSVAGEPFPEISCISAMEAQAAGCVCVHPNYGALFETVASTAGPFSPLFEYERPDGSARDGDRLVITDEWRENFVKAVVMGLEGWQPAIEARADVLERCDWSDVADEWEARLFDRPFTGVYAGGGVVQTKGVVRVPAGTEVES